METTTTTVLDPTTRSQIETELKACRQTQSWAHGATRSGWTSELSAILEADDASDAEGVAEAIEAAKAEAERLARIVAEDLATDVERLRRAIEAATEVDTDGLDTVAELVAAVAAAGETVQDADRDGYTVVGDSAVAYAAIRSWVPDDVDYVEAALVGEA